MSLGAVVAQRPRIAREAAKKSVLRSDIQGLRMVAVVAVILDHLIGWPSGGFVGVDVFFVISGFLITGLLLREHEKTGTISFWGFYRRRIKRIIPVSLLVVVLVVAAAWFVFNRTRFWSTLWDGIYATIFAANWHFAAVGTDYFQAEVAISPLQHYWSLSVEEQFYFVWPWLMLLIFVLTARLTNWTDRAAVVIAGLVLLVLVAGSFCWALWETAANPTWAYFSTLSRTWELGVGGLIAVFGKFLTRIPAFMRSPLGWLGLIGIAVSLFVVNSDSAFPAPWAALPVLSTALVIIAGTGGEQKYMWPLTNPASRYIGDISYSLYVWHWPIIVFGFLLFGDNPITIVILLVAIFGISSYSYHFFEDPIRRSDWLEPRRKTHRSPSRGRDRKKAQLGVAILVTVTSVALAGMALSRPLATPAAVDYTPSTAAPTQTPGLNDVVPPELASLRAELTAALAAQAYPSNLKPTIDDAMTEPQAPEDILRCGFDGSSEDQCTFGSASAIFTAVLVGNSVSMTYVAPLELALGDQWRIVAYGMFGCPFDDYGKNDVSKLGVVPAGCAGRPDQAVDAINRMAPNVVFVSGIGPQARSELGKITVPSSIVFLPGPPTGDTDLSTCYSPLSGPSACVTTQARDWAKEERSLAKLPGMTLVQSWDLFCVDRKCPAFAGTIPMRIDKSHITHEYGQRIAPVLREELVALEPFSGKL